MDLHWLRSFIMIHFFVSDLHEMWLMLQKSNNINHNININKCFWYIDWLKSMLLLYLIISDCNGRLLFNFAEDTAVDYRTVDYQPHFTHKPEHETCNRYFKSRHETLDVSALKFCRPKNKCNSNIYVRCIIYHVSSV